MSDIRTLQVIYGHMRRKISRKQAERFILAHNASPDGKHLPIPHPPVARFWCRIAPEGAPAKYVIGWTAPTVVLSEQERQTKALNDSGLIKLETREMQERKFHEEMERLGL